MAQVTKKMLEDQLKQLEAKNIALETKTGLLREQLEFFRKYSAPGVNEVITRALESTCDAVAHVLGDLTKK